MPQKVKGLEVVLPVGYSFEKGIYQKREINDRREKGREWGKICYPRPAPTLLKLPRQMYSKSNKKKMQK